MRPAAAASLGGLAVLFAGAAIAAGAAAAHLARVRRWRVLVLE